jgi:hypothetical protein
MISMGFVQNYGGLVTTRILLGAMEAGMKPGKPILHLIFLLFNITRLDEAYQARPPMLINL